MKRLLPLVSLYLIFVAGYPQSPDRKARRLFDEGCESISRKEFREAIKKFSDALKISPGFLEAYENRGVAKYYLLDYKGAIEDYNIALEINPNDFNTYGRRGWAKFRLQDYEGAIEDFTEAIKGVTDKAQYHNIRGEAKYHIGDLKEAVSDFDQVINSFSAGKYHKSKAFYWRGMIKIELGQKESGCNDLKEAGKLGLEHADLLIQVYCK